MEQEKNNIDENIKFSHIEDNSELENMYFSDGDFITCFRNFMDESLNQSLKDLKQDYSLKEVDIKGIKAAWVESLNLIKNEGVIIYLHGGCYIYGNINNYCTIPVQLSNTTGIKVLSVNYSLAPENPFPKAIEDVQNIYEYLIEEGYTSDQIVIVGDSAGGGLALATVIKLRDLKVDLPAALGLFSPWVDLTLKGDTIETLKDFDNVLSKRQLEGAAKIYAEKQELTNPLISPVFADLKNCPPMMILAGGREILLSDSINLARKATLDNTTVNFIVWDKLDHVFAVDSTLPESKEAIEILGKFLLEKMNYK